MKKYKPYLNRVDLVKNQVEREELREQEAKRKRSRSIQEQNRQRWLKYQEQLRSELAARYFHAVQSTGGASGGGFTNTLSTTFDGVDDYVDCGTSLNTYLDLGDSFSFAGWFKINVGGTNQSLVDNIGTSTLGVQCRVTNTNRVRLVLAQNSYTYIYRDSSVLNTATWYHVCVTYDGSNTLAGFNVYIDGGLDNSTGGSQNTMTSVTSTESFTIGRAGSFSGNIDEVAVFNTELSQTNITDIYNLGTPNDISAMSGLVSYWRMGDGSTYPTINDEIGSNNGTMTNMSSANFVTDVPI